MASRKLFYSIILGLMVAIIASYTDIGKSSQAYDKENSLMPFYKESLGKIVKSRNGKPFILAFWSVSCGICIREMEVWREIRDQYPNFDLVLVTTDPIKNEPRINQVLEREDMQGFEKWAFADPIPARLRSVVDSKWRGELPRIHFYDSGGKADVRMGMIGKKDVIDWLVSNEK